MSNPYTDRACELLRWREGNVNPEAALAEAQVSATLAVAYEQRTANLIAIFADGGISGIVGFPYEDVLNEIKERLEL